MTVRCVEIRIQSRGQCGQCVAVTATVAALTE